MKVSIVVPVYNPGSAIEPLIASIGGQSMPASEFEAIFVDDGSTDDTPARLDALAAERPNVRVIHEENSGWPGRPRNVGPEAASGEWVYFVDNDDYLAPQALERLYAVATANGADVAIGKEASNWRGVSLGVFRKNRPACTVHDAPLMDTLTPHKMFRRVFLAANDIRFPEGRRRLEDQLFVVRAYLAARVVSVVSDYVCYFYVRRADKRNAGSERIDPHSYFSNVREVIDVIVAHLEAGPARDRLVNRFVRTEMLGRLREPAFARYDPEFRRRLFEAIRELVMDPVTVGAQRGLATFQDLRLRLVREDRLDDLVALAERLSRVSATARLEPPRWAEGRLRLAYTTELRLDGERDRPLVARANGRCLVDRSITAGIVNGPLDVGPDLGSFRVNTYVRESETGTE